MDLEDMTKNALLGGLGYNWVRVSLSCCRPEAGPPSLPNSVGLHADPKRNQVYPLDFKS